MAKVPPDTMEETNRAGSVADGFFFRIVAWSTSLAFGGMLASIEALHNGASGFAFRVSGWTMVAFAIGVVVGLIYWKIVLPSSTAGPSSRPRIMSFFLLLGGVAAFLYPLRFVPTKNLREIFIGLAAAAVALSLVGLMLWRLKIFFDKDAATVESKDPAPPDL
jgi:hypothetical protein